MFRKVVKFFVVSVDDATDQIIRCQGLPACPVVAVGSITKSSQTPRVFGTERDAAGPIGFNGAVTTRDIPIAAVQAFPD